MIISIKKIFIVGIIITMFLSFGFAEGNAGKEKPQFNPDLNYAQVVFVKAVRGRGDVWYFEVTVRHNDEGWDHYANVWQVVNPEDNSVIAERVLAHPHENEQPFTRSLGGIKMPEGVKEVLVRARCNLHGYEGKTVLVDLTKKKGEDYRVENPLD